ncbi:MAG: bifunctional acetate--CoA ligase family protein/GNAT family N-acetyltransferase [Boseongicola sp.]|nr:bifunctional acetate--CoA ligase family protein/GNAT family N-acetyltransferase [Boseongicola sp.]
MGPSPLHPMLNPRSVAVFGASHASDSVGAKVYANLLKAGFEGPIHPINPKHKTLNGKPCFASLADIKSHVDLAVIATPAHTVPEIIRQCGEAGTKNAIVLSAGFGEGGTAQKDLGDKLKDAANRGGVRLLGPNCVGLVRPWLGLDATFLKATTPKGGLALVSQSGALCSAISDWAEPNQLGFSALVSLGNALDIGFGDAVDALAIDPKTNAILLYVEGLRDASSFISAVRRATRTKPVVVLKVGRHSQSSKAAQTHTGALMGSDDVFDAALTRAGAVRVDTFGQLFAAAEILSANKRAHGNRLAIITNGGGAGVLAADRAGDLNVDLPPPSETTLKALDKQLPKYWSRSNPIDILGDAKPADYKAAIAAAMDDPAFDGVLVMLTPQAMTDATEVALEITETVTKQAKKPVLACWMGESSVSEGRKHLSSNGIPDFTTPERSVEAFSYLAQHHLNRQLALEAPGPLPNGAPPDLDGVRLIIRAALMDGRSMLSDIESKAVLRAFGIPVNLTLEAAEAKDALVAAETLGFPVAMKINSPQITHKSDIGGVRIGISTAAELNQSFYEIITAARAAKPDADIRGVTVEAMAHIEDARELVIGVSKDPIFGPAILFGAGGTMVEVMRDSAVTLPPLTAVLARRLIDRTKVSRLLEGFRDLAPVDTSAVIDVLLHISDLVCEVPEITELDINPLFAGPSGTIAVDARIRIAQTPSNQNRYDHVAIHPYPRHLVSHHHLPDGTPLIIRPIRPEDAESEAAFVRNLSPEAKRFRFMGALRELTSQMLVQFTQIDYRTEMTLIAAIEGNTPRQVGVARYAINPDKTSCEFAIVVSDDLQHQGIGTMLMQALMKTARDKGLTRIEGTVLRDNEDMLDLMRDLEFEQSTDLDTPDVIRVSRAL